MTDPFDFGAFDPNDPSYIVPLESEGGGVDMKKLWSDYKEAVKNPIETVTANFFTKEAYSKKRLLGTGMKAAGTGLGLIIAADSLRAEREGADGRPETRSGLVRVGEAVLGLGVSAGAMLYPGR